MPQIATGKTKSNIYNHGNSQFHPVTGKPLHTRLANFSSYMQFGGQSCKRDRLIPRNDAAVKHQARTYKKW
jgi:hypothetical protein